MMNSNKVCKNCKWWNSDESCDFPNTVFAEDKEGQGKRKMETHATVWDDCGLSVYLFTGPEFGCVHFKTRKSNHE